MKAATNGPAGLTKQVWPGARTRAGARRTRPGFPWAMTWGTALVAAALALAAAQPAAAVQVGQTLPNVMLDTAQGPRQLAPAQARVTYVDFWASWCGPCRQSFPWMNEMQAKYAAKGLRIVGVNVDAKRADADEFLARTPAQFAIAYDRERAFAQAVDVKAMPTSLLVDQRGRVLMVHYGFAGKDREKLEAAIAEALREAQP